MEDPREAFEGALAAWNRTELVAAADGFRRAIALSAPGDMQLADAHTALGQVLCQLGDNSGARAQLELGVRVARSDSSDNERSIQVVVARYFLADHLLHMKLPLEALEVVAPPIAAQAYRLGLLRLVEAEALFALGDVERARTSANLAVQSAVDIAQKARIADRLRAILEFQGS